MRTRVMFVMGALLLASAALAQAQDLPRPERQSGIVEIGGRTTDVDGDAARFGRFRDLRDGAYVPRLRFNLTEEAWLFSAEATNVGYRDQRYAGSFQRVGKLKASFAWDQVPMFISGDTRTLFTDVGGGQLVVDDAVQQGIQSGRLSIADAVAGLQPFEMRSRRDTAAFALTYTASRDLDFKVDVSSVRREGEMPFSGFIGSSPGNPVVEIPAPIDDRTTSVRAALEWANARGRVNVAYDGSLYDNSVETIRWDNPLRFTDIVSGGSQGQRAWWPNNTAHTVSTSGGISLPGRSRASAFVSIGAWSQDDPLLPATINTALAAPVLPRASAEAEARVIATNLGFSSRPIKHVRLNARYRLYDYDNRTPHFAMPNLVVGDFSVGSAAENEPFSHRRHTFDADVAFSAIPFASVKVGYGHEAASRTFRIFEETAQDALRVTVDSIGNRYLTLRGKWELSQRSGSGFDEHVLDHVGEQHGMRHYDIADRDRNRGTLMLVFTPLDALGLNASLAAGKDDYKNTEFGLRDNDHRVYGAGFDVVPSDTVSFTFNYDLERYNAFQYSRTANPPSPTNGQFFDPTRDWSIDSADEVHTVATMVELNRLVPNTEIRLTYDLSKAKVTYVYGIAPNATIPVPAQLPAVVNELQSGTADVRYFFWENVALGVTYWYDDYQVSDFAMDAATINRVDLPSAIYLGYVYRPYTAHTAAVRLSYRW